METQGVRGRDVAPLDAEQGVTVLVTLGLCLLLFGVLSMWAARDSVIPSSGTPVLLVLGGVALVGALIVHVGRGRSNE
jgi:hypothetical protein